MSSLRPRTAWAMPAPPSFVIPVHATVARDAAGAGVVDDAWLDAQLARASELFGPFGITVALVGRSALPAASNRLETREDRDALAALRQPGVANLFVVESLRDVDDPDRFRMGVHWRRLTDVSQRYIIVAMSARGSTYAHELGHYLGNGHTSAVNNLMSYDRDGGAIYVDDDQGRRALEKAAQAFATKELLPVASFFDGA